MELQGPYDKLVPWCKLPEHANQTDEERLKDLEDPTIKKLRPLSSAELLGWAAANDRFAKIEDCAANGPPSVRSIGKAAKLLISRDVTVLDLNLSDRQAMVAALVAAGALSQSDVDSLYAMVSYHVSQIDDWGVSINIGHLVGARDQIEKGA